MGLFDAFKKKAPAGTAEYLNDVTFIKQMRHISSGPWHQYDVLLAARGYGWDAMIDWADYMAAADLEQISQVTAGSMGENDNDLTESFHNNNGKCADMPELKTEMGVLSLAGISKTLRSPMKIVWFNQTRVLRFFTPVDDEALMGKYAETVVRRTFGTAQAMKSGKPLPKA